MRTVARRVPQHVQFAGGFPFLQVTAEPPGDHFVDGGDVALAVGSLDAEPAVLALAGQPVLEHHRGRDDVGA